jgi:hypothetical protein
MEILRRNRKAERTQKLDDLRPGEWFFSGEPEFIVIVQCCPSCKFYMTNVRHEIAADGTVSPSMVCPHEPCTWHVSCRLDGWDPVLGAQRQRRK